MKRQTLGRIVLLLLSICLTLAGCKSKESVEVEPEPSPTPTYAIAQQPTQRQTRTVIHVSDMLVGFIAPKNEDTNLRTALHGFLRTAETLGYPAKLYYAGMGTPSVAAVEQAAEEGCRGLLIWNPNGNNANAIARAATLNIPVIVPYHTATGEGIASNVYADLTGYAEEVALGIAERMVERSCKAGKILLYGTNPEPLYNIFVHAIATYYPQFNVSYFKSTATTEQLAIEELSTHILWNRDIKGLFACDVGGANVAVLAREKATAEFRANGAPEAKASPTPVLSPSPAPGTPTTPTTPTGSGPSATPVPEGLIQSILISVAGYGLDADSIALMEDNDIYACVLEPYYEAAAQSMMLLDQLLHGENVSDAMRQNMPIVRMDTLDKYALIRSQVLNWFSE